ncbi:MAG: hypothetical protein DRI69_05245 [Bacteroidetes bacterium]|nr:MAG: hypothetical protein DRI69_05245 [Bacteroidota bacterium]
MGSRILYYLVILPISILPYRLLYGFSDFLFLIVYSVIGYRREVTLTNLKNSFPEKSNEDLNNIMRKFYHHFCDLVVESLKGFTISEKQLRKRVVLRNPEIMEKWFQEGKDIMIIGGHFNNWEIVAQGIGLKVKHMPIGIYKALHNKFFDGKMKKSREKYRLLMVPIPETKVTFETDFGVRNAMVFGMDQNPGRASKGHWMTFLNQDTVVAFGAERYAKEYNRPVVHTAVHKVKRGHYEVEFRVITESPNDLPHGAITELCTKSIEKDIVEKPEFWLWTHRRWKAKRPA